MEKNKIIRKYLLPRVFFVTALGVVGGAVVYNAAELKNEVYETNRQHTVTDPFFVACAALLAALVMWYIVGTYKDANKAAVNVARDYIKKAIKDYPDLADFESVLSNDRAMKHLAAVIANNLRPSEQKEVKDIVLKTDLIFDPLKKEEAYKQIEQVIKNHIHVHPEFIPNIYGEMGYAEHNYIICARNKNNRQK